MSIRPRVSNSLETRIQRVLLDCLRDKQCTQLEYEGWRGAITKTLQGLCGQVLSHSGDFEDHAGLCIIDTVVPEDAAATTRWVGAEHHINFTLRVEMQRVGVPDAGTRTAVHVALDYSCEGERETVHEHTFPLRRGEVSHGMVNAVTGGPTAGTSFSWMPLFSPVSQLSTAGCPQTGSGEASDSTHSGPCVATD